MLAMLFILLVCVGNFALGFMLAAHFGHGPTWAEPPHPEAIRNKLRAILRMGGKQTTSSH